MSVKIKNLIIFFALIIAIFAVADFALAAVDPWGGKKTAVEGAIGLGTDDPRIIAASVIRVALGFLGVIALGLIIYAGFLWMTSAGNEQKIEQAKKILKNALIGLIIILASFGIVSFIIEKLLEQTGAGGPGGGQPPQFGAGIGALGDCSIASVYPEPGQQEVPRNTAVVVTFREEVDPATICDDANTNGVCDNGELVISENVRIFKTGAGDGCETTSCADNITEVSVSTNDNKTFIFIPKNYLGSPSEYIWHTVYLSNDIVKAADGKGIFSTCKADYFEWQFEVSNKIDLEPPQIKEGGIFPAPDNQADEINTTSAAVQATGGITVNNNPYAYAAATVQNPPVNVGGSEDAAVSGSYNCLSDGTINVSINGVTNKADVSGPLGIVTGDDITDNIASLGCGLTLIPEDGTFTSGNSWTIAVTAEKQADTLTVGSVTYTFVAGAPVGNQIQLGAIVNNTASNIAAALASHPDVFAAIGSAPNIVKITAKVAGAAGNNIALSTSNTSALIIDPMSGGQDQETITTVNDAQDKPRNAVIQINFNEAINPSTVSGSASEVADYIRVVNADPAAAGAGAACAVNINCLSFKCDTTGLCAGDYLEGKFAVSNQYSTVEFISNNLCGVNGCGEKIYCLPENSHVKVELMAAGLADCGADNCASRSPYNICAAGHCQNSAGENYPLSAAPLDGIADMALNSLDGNRDNGAGGPVTFYNENNPNLADGDNYQWSFFISGQIDLASPEITGIRQIDINGVEQPMNQGDTGIHLVNPILINFSKLMMASSLSTGSRIIESGDEDITHQLINIWNFTNKPVGYWVTKIDNDSTVPLDGEPDWTQALLKHSMFSDSTGYRAQAGSGVRDIYQNCFKPSTGPGCIGGPSCCGGVPSAGSSCP